jgi:hypothetical protein
MAPTELVFLILMALVGLAFAIFLVTVIVARIRSGTDRVDPESMSERLAAQKDYPVGYAAPGGPERR